MGDPTGIQRRVRSGHGAGAGHLQKAVRRAQAGNLHGRVPETVDIVSKAHGPDGTGTGGPGVLRIRQARHGQHIHGQRTFEGVPPGRGDAAQDEKGLGDVRQTVGRRTLPGGGQNNPGDGQFQDPRRIGVLRDLRTEAGQTDMGQLRVRLYPEARQLAEHGADRAARTERPMPEPAHINHGRGQGAGSRMAGAQEQQNESDKPAVHDKGIPDKT